MTQLTISTNRLSYPLIGNKTIYLPTIDVQKEIREISLYSRNLIRGTLFEDFWVVFSNKLD